VNNRSRQAHEASNKTLRCERAARVEKEEAASCEERTRLKSGKRRDMRIGLLSLF
jgi:hypothetical protein